MAVIGKAEEILGGASRLPGGYFVRTPPQGGRQLVRADPATGMAIGCGTYQSPGEAFEAYVKAYAQELVLSAPFVDGSNVERALEEMERLVREMANHWKGGG